MDLLNDIKASDLDISRPENIWILLSGFSSLESVCNTFLRKSLKNFIWASNNNLKTRFN